MGLRAGFPFTTLAIRLLSDHLGSASAVVSADGTAAQTQGYYPWGETRFGSLETEYQFTGQYRESYINLYWYNSRWYDPVLGRWIQPDVIVPEAVQGVQAWDRYAYSNNSPVVHNDPSGHCIDGVTTILCIAMGVGALVGGAASVINLYQNNDQVSAGQVVEAAIGGALGGAVLGGGLVIAGAAVAIGASALAGVGAAACADGDCTNEAQSVASSATSAIQPYYPPNLGFSGTPQVTTLQPGELVSRYGSTSGTFLSPAGTPSWASALPPGAENLTLNTYQVVKPIENVLSGPAAPWWGKIGGAIQYYVGTPYGQNVKTLLDSGYLEPR